MNENFDVRKSICKLEDTARALGAAAHYAGSGGSILGIYENAGMLERLRKAFEAMGCRLIVPVVTSQRCGSSS